MAAWRMPFKLTMLWLATNTQRRDAWQYAFDVQQNVPDLIALYGGDHGFIQKMDTMFTTNSYINTGIPDISGRIGQYSQGDEQMPSCGLSL
jgi:putative alpha-1,2-mannosidase